MEDNRSTTRRLGISIEGRSVLNNKLHCLDGHERRRKRGGGVKDERRRRSGEEDQDLK